MLEEAGVIRGYVAVVEQKAVGLPVSVFISIKLERQRESRTSIASARPRSRSNGQRC